MNVYVVFAHPSRRSFTADVLAEFVKGLQQAGHSAEVGDLYRMGFRSEMDVSEYEREVALDADAPLPRDVRREQERIDSADGLAFVYPLWWSDCPAKLKGWFDRVLAYGYAYSYGSSGERLPPKMDVQQALVLCTAGHTVDHLRDTGIAASIRHVMLEDRLLGVGVRKARLEVLGGMAARKEEIRRSNLERAYELGRTFR
jgi:NAD(P)H dehydrogenase (quinone)